MKKLMNFNGVKILGKVEQKSISGGAGSFGKCSSSCAGKPTGAVCWHQNSCLCEARCTAQGCIPI